MAGCVRLLAMVLAVLGSWSLRVVRSDENGICGIPCCNVQPNCAHALLVGCECPDQDSITLRRGDIPQSVHSIYITASGQVTLQKNAFLDLSSLATLFIDLMHEGELNVDENGLALQHSHNAFFLRIENAKVAFFANSAFSGFWSDSATIKLQIIQKLYIHQNSLGFSSNLNGPSLTMDHVGELHLAPNAIVAPISSLYMSTVYMPRCLNESFDGKIFRMKLKNVKIDIVRRGCLVASHAVQVSIDSCSIETIQSEGFSGKVSELEIRNTAITQIEEHGFFFRVGKLRIENCRFGDLATRGLSVAANDSISLDGVNITTTRSHALAGLQVLTNQTGRLRQSTHLHNLRLTHTERGSLAFSEQTKLRLTGSMDVSTPDPLVCPTRSWACCLVGKPECDQLNDADRKVLSKLKPSWRCPGAEAASLQGSDPSEKQTGTDSYECFRGDREEAIRRKVYAVNTERGGGMTPFEDEKVGSRGMTHLPCRTEATEPEIPLGDDTMDSPKTSHMTIAPQLNEAPKPENLLGSKEMTIPGTTPMTEIAEESESDDPKEISFFSVPDADTSTEPGVDQGGDTNAVPSEKGTSRTLSSSDIILIVLAVIVIAVSLRYGYSRLNRKQGIEEEADSFRQETTPLQADQPQGNASENAGGEQS